jgi:WD40 repeat protein
MNAPAPLLTSLGAHWNFGAPVVAATWDTEGRAVGFALGDGHLAVASAKWLKGPRVVPKDGGGVTLLAAETPAPQPLRAACHPDSCLCLTSDARGGFLTGGDDGRVVHVPRVGDPKVLTHHPGTWIDAIACNREGARAYASGRHVQRLSTDDSVGEALELPAPATAIAFSPDGHTLAIAHSGGVTLWSDKAPARLLAWHGYHRALAWSPDGRYIVAGMQENALHGWRVADGGDIEMGGYPGQPLSLSFAHDGRYLATSGAMRPVCWGFSPPGSADQPTECGLVSKTPVSCVSCHPQQSLIAAGYFNGAVLLCQPGSDEGLFLKGSGGGAVNALTWSGDGSRIAFGTQEGELGWLSLPDTLFRSRTA